MKTDKKKLNGSADNLASAFRDVIHEAINPVLDLLTVECKVASK